MAGAMSLARNESLTSETGKVYDVTEFLDGEITLLHVVFARSFIYQNILVSLSCTYDINEVPTGHFIKGEARSF